MKLCDVTECPSPLACDTKDYTQALQDYTQALTNDRGWLRDSAEKRGSEYPLDVGRATPDADRGSVAAARLGAGGHPEGGAQVAGWLVPAPGFHFG